MTILAKRDTRGWKKWARARLEEKGEPTAGTGREALAALLELTSLLDDPGMVRLRQTDDEGYLNTGEAEPAGMEGKLQTADSVLEEKTCVEVDGGFEITLTGHRHLTNTGGSGGQRIYSAVFEEKPEWYDDLVIAKKMSVEYRRFGKQRVLLSACLGAWEVSGDDAIDFDNPDDGELVFE